MGGNNKESKLNNLKKSSRPFSGLSRGLESPIEGPPEKKEQTGKEAIIFHPVKMRNNQRRRVQVRVKREMEQGDGAVAIYQDTTNPTRDHFQPFDLDAWWGRKLYQDLTSGL